MPRKKSKYISKQVSFNREEDVELLKWLQKLPHGEFSNQSKEYWINKMREDKPK